jgi:ERCC4-related helicase
LPLQSTKIGIRQLFECFQGIERKAQERKAPKNIHVLLSSPWYHEARKLLETLTLRAVSHPKYNGQVNSQSSSREEHVIKVIITEAFTKSGTCSQNSSNIHVTCKSQADSSLNA